MLWGFKEEPETKSSFTPQIKRLDFRGITDAAGTTFSHSLVIMGLVLEDSKQISDYLIKTNSNSVMIEAF